MKILIATNSCHLPQQFGGSEVSIHELVLSLQEQGHEVEVVASLNRHGSLYWRNRLLARLGRRRFPADQVMGYRVYRGWRENDSILSGIAEVLRHRRPDVLFIQGAQVIELAAEAARFGLPILCSLVDVEAPNLRTQARGAGLIRYIANSHFTARRIAEQLGLDCVVVHPLIRAERYATSTERRSVVFVNPHPFKGGELVLKLARLNPDIPFVIQESWPLKPDYRRAYLAEVRDLPNVEYRTPTQDMRTLYAGARILLAPSQYEEAWGRVANEAQINGIPVIASNRGGLPEAVGDGGLILNHDASPEEWSAALRQLWLDGALYEALCQRALQRTRSGVISQGHISRQILELFEQLLQAARLPTIARAG